MGFEAVGGARLAAGAFDVEIQGRRFELRDVQGYVEQGYSLSTTYNPSNDASGWSLSLAPTWGHAAQTFDPFALSQGISTRFTPWVDSQGDPMEFSVHGSLGYGFLVSRERFVVAPYIQSQSYMSDAFRLGVRLRGITQSTLRLEMNLQVQREDVSRNEKDSGVTVAATLRF